MRVSCLMLKTSGSGTGLCLAGSKVRMTLSSLLLPVGVPGLSVLVVPLLLEDRRTVGCELEDEDTMHLLRESAAAGVEALELGRGVSDGRERCAEQNQNGDWRRSVRMGAIVHKGTIRDN